ncbi:hypothetical protein BGI52_14810 [Burkholderia pseudomallei]|uniref:hypothetical protein n=1 Tax=Burkholderia pseudomallei TaxID=28450 RepID=UPI0005726588|nr:hypothetical protein [Burkholderia pseudomallei]APZ00111.1 hypothetical protein BGI49_14710 [Burkholderia pseudomallei]APZ13696.1 hypothetical protein BGI52_14810 [Burkholderia pseudomallei]
MELKMGKANTIELTNNTSFTLVLHTIYANTGNWSGDYPPAYLRPNDTLIFTSTLDGKGDLNGSARFDILDTAVKRCPDATYVQLNWDNPVGADNGGSSSVVGSTAQFFNVSGPTISGDYGHPTFSWSVNGA